MSSHTVRTWFIAAFFIIPGIFLVLHHQEETGVPFVVDPTESEQIELSVSFSIPATKSESKKTRELRLWLPEENPHWSILDEQISSGKFSLVILDEDVQRKAILSARSSEKGDLSAEYRLQLQRRGKSLRLSRSKKKLTNILSQGLSSDIEELFLRVCGELAPKTGSILKGCFPTFVRELRSEFATRLEEELQITKLSDRDLATLFEPFFHTKGRRTLSGLVLPLRGFQSSIEPRYGFMIDTSEREIVLYDFRTETVEVAKNYFVWGSDEEILESSKGLSGMKTTIASVAIPSIERTMRRAANDSLLVRYLSLDRLPLSTQALFEITLLLPLAALIVCVVRNFIGLVTFGTFMPALLGLAFLQTGMVSGLVLTLLILGIGCIARLAAEKLHMLLVPRLTMVLTTVILLFYLLTQLSFDLGWQSGAQISLFPVIVLTMMVERLTLILDEYGFTVALGRLASTLFTAFLCFLVLSHGDAKYLFFHFPELNLVVLGIAIVFGRYTGYRLTELVRFRDFGSEAR